MNNVKPRTLVVCEVFYPEEFIINDLVGQWNNDCRIVDIITRVPSYPLGKVFRGFRNSLFQKETYGNGNIYRLPIIPGYCQNRIIKILNYIQFLVLSCLFAAFRGRKYENVFIFQTGPLTVASSAIILKKIFNSHIVLWTQDIWPETVYAYGFRRTKILDYFLTHLVRTIYRNVDSILVPCEGLIDKVRAFSGATPIIYVPNWSLVNYEPTKKVSLPGEVNFTFAGNIGKVQNLENVIEGFAVLVRKHKNVFLNIIGDGSNLINLKMLVKREKIKNVNFVGRVPSSDISNYFSVSDYLIISLIDSPLYESMIPSKFQAYLCTKKPLLAVINGELKSIVEKNKIGLAASPTDILSISEKMEALLLMTDTERTLVCQNSERLSTTVYSRELIVEKINSIMWK